MQQQSVRPNPEWHNSWARCVLLRQLRPSCYVGTYMDGSCTNDSRREGMNNTDGSNSVVVRLIEDEAAFQLLEKPWSELAAAAGARPFQDFYWANAWIQTIGRSSGRKLRV